MADIKIIVNNKKARHEYELMEEFEAGLVLLGTEVKSLRSGKGSLNGAYCRFYKEDLYVYGMHIPEYSHGNVHNHDPDRTRKLLMHKRELRRIVGLMSQKGYTLIPVKLYFKRGLAKLEIALAKGKKLHDKRETIKKREVSREISRRYKA